jgi:hypothetical protein
MSTIDEVRDYAKFESLTFVDFLEALGLVADTKPLPRANDLAEAGINSLQWATAKANGQLHTSWAMIRWEIQGPPVEGGGGGVEARRDQTVVQAFGHCRLHADNVN